MKYLKAVGAALAVWILWVVVVTFMDVPLGNAPALLTLAISSTAAYLFVVSR